MNNPQQQIELQEKQETTEQMIFRQFQERFKELAEYTLSKPDEEILLACYRMCIHDTIETIMETEEGSWTITGNICKSAYCICGNMPELWPDEYEWGDVPQRIGVPIYDGLDQIYELILPGNIKELKKAYPSLPELFEYNSKSQTRTDREEIQERLRTVMRSKDLKDLNHRMMCQ